MTNPQIIPSHGGYANLLSYRKAEVIYDATVKFCARFFRKYDRTTDQMVQAVRSGKQNIVEGSMVSGTSKEGELKLTGVARASLEELLTDYRDFLRTRNMHLWEKDSKESLEIRNLGKSKDFAYENIQKYVEAGPAEVAANVIICLIRQANYLLNRQLQALEKYFLEHGGLRERMTKARIDARNQKKNSDNTK
ncbi:MAG TPA: four helix bundle suffix domain-containing protein [Bacteroidales bacterium]|nr:four helix bundle suffix domain-containing protein [Bacteroidales bacterium]HPF02258.1 four helix bundle suffix domain-containing protein [Bacteroidales bacterium]HPJ58782.1 four helix bundle suffix domain-containing protein [Bacteroidales bacterium]HPR11932.1 four helix bundle suffix domain-containing protein [Bacteroidales bacterium]HRW85369.1 four helix bundle suffix domain-containing protein [Bacteroidales bacterium]